MTPPEKRKAANAGERAAFQTSNNSENHTPLHTLVKADPLERNGLRLTIDSGGVMYDAIEQFRDSIRATGLIPPDLIEADGNLHRFTTNGRRHDDAGWYVLHGDGIPAGIFGDWRTGISTTWRANIGRTLTPAEDVALRAKLEASRRTREAAKAREQAEAAGKAAAIWTAAKPAPENHPYLIRKGIKASGARLHHDALVIPMRVGDALHSLQFIGPDGDKRLLSGGRAAGCYFCIGNLTGVAALAICEGFATGASIYEATGYPVAVAFSAVNLGPVAVAMREKFPDLRLILCADDDTRTAGNPGLTKATEAARSVGGWVAIPDFGSERPDTASDFNDLAAHQGLGIVLRAVTGASPPARVEPQPSAGNAAAGNFDGWPEPQALTLKMASEPYPTDALPDTIRAAVEEVAGFIKAPIPMVASSALSALSLATQAHIDVKRAERLQGPVGLFLMTIADSGERKSTCDGIFTSSIRQYQDEQAEVMKPAITNHLANTDAWAAERDGLLSAIKEAGKKSKPYDDLRERLAELQCKKPELPRVPRLLLGDETPESLAWSLAKYWPSAGVVSAEAGIVFGAHGMGKDSVMRNLGLLNVLWDGGSHSVGRRSSESFTVKGARLTVALQIQEPTLREFFTRSGALARGTGFLARFLVAWPDSTQGQRPFTDPPENWPHLAKFHRRLAAILNQPAPINEDGALTPDVLSLAPAAKAAWVEYHDTIEVELVSGGELYDVRDVASKSADNAVRLAALFEIFEHGTGGAVGLDCFESASRIAAWHLNESRRFFGELALPVELANAARLDSWLIDYSRRERTPLVPIAKLQQGGPGGLRSKANIETAMRELEDAGRARWVMDGKRKMIAVNPALLPRCNCEPG